MGIGKRGSKTLGLTLLVVLLTPLSQAMESEWPMTPMNPDLQNLPSLQNGWRLYTNYCLGCHSLKYQRYERTADDLGVPHDIVLEQLIFSGQKIGEQMTTAMDPEMAKNWFGAPPPDLTMVARLRGVDWLYNYLRTFYLDESRPFGVNNKVFPNVGMPKVLHELQGTQTTG
ncbi:MAG: cytochrome c1, partial [Pseudomonadales bacterium]